MRVLEYEAGKGALHMPDKAHAHASCGSAVLYGCRSRCCQSSRIIIFLCSAYAYHTTLEPWNISFMINNISVMQYNNIHTIYRYNNYISNIIKHNLYK